ncbi:MAG: cytidyltransferase [Acidobacteria bacterium]|nr:MAG: cytidyltransferase [Acidobacteriota bacterium]
MVAGQSYRPTRRAARRVDTGSDLAHRCCGESNRLVDRWLEEGVRPVLVTTKIKDIHELAAELELVRRGRTVVQCHGVFDLLHIGHIRHFQQAKKSGEMLIVTVTPDRHVNKGPHRPVFTELLRAEAIAALDGVDYVAINKWPTAVEAIQLLRPDVYAKGSDYANASTDITGGISLERSAIEDIGGKLVFTDEIRFSSSALLNQHMSMFSDEVNEYLTEFRRTYSTADVTGFIDRARTVRALVVGDAIIDDYQYCETLGKSGKEPILAAQFVRSEKFVGGALAVANHIASCCADVRLVTMLGSDDSHEAFIRASLAPGVVPEFLTMAGAPTLIKRRFIETYPFQKLFEVYVMNEQAAQQKAHDLCAVLEQVVPEVDVVIAADYGHGMIGPAVVDVLCRTARCLAVNAQVNAGNHGFNTVSKYRRADFISLSEKEIRLEARNPSGDLRELVHRVAGALQCRQVLVTRGARGSLCYGRDEGFFETPGFALRTVDRVGAGDAVFAIGSVCAAVGAPIEVIGFIGNAVGSEAVGIVGNQRFIERAPLLKHIEALLKV